MKLFISILLLCSYSFGATWTTGNYKIELVKDSEGDWVTKSCMTDCSIDKEIKKILETSPLAESDLMGGKHPGSAICKKLSGKVIYLKNGEEEEAFCELKNNTLSLSRLSRNVLK